MDHVLLIERHQLMRTAIQDLLAHSGSQGIHVAADSLDGIHQAIERQPAVIILDTTLPEVNGIWLSRVLRELAPQSRIVLLVDDTWHADEEIARASGADAFVAKNALSAELSPLLAKWQEGENKNGDEDDVHPIG